MLPALNAICRGQNILFPTLIAVSFRNSHNLEVMASDMGTDMLVTFLQQRKAHRMPLNALVSWRNVSFVCSAQRKRVVKIWCTTFPIGSRKTKLTKPLSSSVTAASPQYSNTLPRLFKQKTSGHYQIPADTPQHRTRHSVTFICDEIRSEPQPNAQSRVVRTYRQEWLPAELHPDGQGTEVFAQTEHCRQ